MGKKEKERKRAHGGESENAFGTQVKDELELQSVVNGGSNEKEKRKKKKRKKEETGVNSSQTPTVSIAVPGSIIHNAQSLELATRVSSLNY